MRTLLRRAVPLALLLTVWTARPDAQQPSTPTFRTGVTLVEVAVSARDGDGGFVGGLQREDFVLEVDGRQAPIETFAEVTDAPDRPSEGRFLLIVVDDVTGNAVLTPRIRRIAHAIIDRMRAPDEAAVLGMNGDQMTSTVDREQLHAQVDAFSRGAKPAPMRPAEHVASVLGDLAEQLGAVERRRKVMIVVGSTALLDIPPPTRYPDGRVDAWLTAVGAAARHNVVVYVIDPQPVTSGVHMGEIGFARETGGAAFKTNLLERAVERVWSDIGNYYLLGYTLEGRQRERRPSLKVRVTRPGVAATARRTAG